MRSGTEQRRMMWLQAVLKKCVFRDFFKVASEDKSLMLGDGECGVCEKTSSRILDRL